METQSPPKKSIILTGVKPTGQPTLGNYLGAIQPALKMSQAPLTETWLFVADYHALISNQEPKKLREMVYEIAAAWLASGLNPETAVLYRQSDVPEILEFNWILACMTPKGLMNRAHAYKAKVAENEEQGKEDLDFGVNMGLYTYPVLMAADILAFNADKVPIGEDQLQHLEITRDIAQKFNRQFGNLLKLPSGVIQPNAKSIPGLDGRKMSKSYDNFIMAFEEPARLKKLVARIKTDSLPPEAPKSTEGSIPFEIYQALATPEQTAALKAKYEAGVSWGAVKEELFQLIDQTMGPKRERYKELLADRGQIDQILKSGADRARQVAAENLKRVRGAIGIGS